MQADQLQAAAPARLVALLSAHDPAPAWPGALPAVDLIRLGVHRPIEHQARQAILAGASELIVHLEDAHMGAPGALDRLARETGVPVFYVSDGPALARRLERSDRVLLLAERMILPQDSLSDLAHGDAPRLLVTPTEPATAQFERIDGQQVWAGGALLSGDMILATLDMLGEWDLALTLLRRAVQANAPRTVLPAELAEAGLLVQLADQADADRLLDALAEGGDAGGPGDWLSVALVPVRRWSVAQMVRRQVNPAHLALGGGFLGVLAVALASLQWSVTALLLALAGEAALGLGLVGSTILLRRRAPRWLRILIKGSSLAVLAVIGGRLAEGGPLGLAGIMLPLGLVAVMTLADARPAQTQRLDRGRRWARLTIPMILITALGGLAINAAMESFLLIGLSAFGTATFRLLAVDEKRI